MQVTVPSLELVEARGSWWIQLPTDSFIRSNF